MATKRNSSEVMQRIVEAATEVFATEGLAGARMDDIAERAGVSKALIYYHVADKESLYGSVMSATLTAARTTLAEASAKGRDPEERLRLAIRAIADLASTNPHFAPLMLREIATGGAGLPDAIVAQMQSVFAVIGDAVGAGVGTGSFREVDPIVIHMLVAGGVLVLIAGTPIRQRVRGGGRRVEDIPDQVASLLLEGIRRRASARSDSKRGR